MKKLFVLALAIAAANAMCIDAKTARKEMMALGNQAKMAFKNEKREVLCGMLDSKFVWKHSGGRPNENKKQACDGLKMFFAMCDNINMNWTEKSMTVMGNKVVMVNTQTMTCKMKDPNGKMHSMKSVGAMRETWMKTSSGWRAIMFEDMPGEKMWMDGKPFDPSKMAPPPKGGGNVNN